MAEDAGIAGNYFELPAGAVELDGTPEGVQPCLEFPIHFTSEVN